MMMGERDLEAELKEKDEIIMSLRLNEHLLRDKLEISRRNMSKQLERITALEKENDILEQKLKTRYIVNKQYEEKERLKKENKELKKQIEDCKDYNSKLYANCLQKDRKWIKEVKRLNEELEESIKENAKLREMYIKLKEMYINDG